MWLIHRGWRITLFRQSLCDSFLIFCGFFNMFEYYIWPVSCHGGFWLAISRSPLIQGLMQGFLTESILPLGVWEANDEDVGFNLWAGLKKKIIRLWFSFSCPSPKCTYVKYMPSCRQFFKSYRYLIGLVMKMTVWVSGKVGVRTHWEIP